MRKHSLSARILAMMKDRTYYSVHSIAHEFSEDASMSNDIYRKYYSALTNLVQKGYARKETLIKSKSPEVSFMKIKDGESV